MDICARTPLTAWTAPNSGDNLGPGSPVFHWEQTHDPNIHVRLILKGGGCENMSAQYSLPMEIQGKRADRNLEGVRACILDAVWKAQGKGCGPGFIGVAIGGDRASGFDFAKRQLLRQVDDSNPDPQLAELESRIMNQAKHPRYRSDGFLRQVHGRLLQGWKAEPLAGVIFCFGGVYVLGLPPAR